jgi:hypothetical protein
MQASRITDRTVHSLQCIGPYKMLNFDGSVRTHATLLRPSTNHEHLWMWSPNTIICATHKSNDWCAICDTLSI